MRIHILGICGTFMGGVAALAKAAGHQVSGSDENVYPPMSTQLRKLGIRLQEGYDQAQLNTDLDCVLVGNVMSRGNPVVEALLESGLPYYSGPEWLAANVLKDKWVFAVAGTHGKTTTTSMLAWILDYAGLDPGFLVGGGAEKLLDVGTPRQIEVFRRRGGRIRHGVLRQASQVRPLSAAHARDHEHRVRSRRHLPGSRGDSGPVPAPVAHDPGSRADHGQRQRLQHRRVAFHGYVDTVETFSARDRDVTWAANYDLVGAKSRFSVWRGGEKVGQTGWALIGPHNLENALAAISSAVHAGVSVDLALEALSQFQGVKRRLEKRGVYQAVSVYEDFAHHPTEIATTLSALRAQHANRRIIAVVEPRSNSMRMGVHEAGLRQAFDDADRVFMLASEQLEWDPESAFATLGDKLAVERDVEVLLHRLTRNLTRGDQVVLMSNGSFQGLPRLLQQALKSGNLRVAAE